MKAIAILPLILAAAMAPAFAQTTPPMTVPLANKHLAGVVESVESVDGELHVVIEDNDGYDDDVTIANDAPTRPAGSQLAVGDRVLLTGYNAGSYFDATAVSIVGSGNVAAAPPPPAPTYTAPPAQNQLPSYADPVPAYPAYTYVPYPVYVPAPVYYPYPVSIGVGFYGGYRGPGYSVRAGYGRPGYARPGYARPYGYRRR